MSMDVARRLRADVAANLAFFTRLPVRSGEGALDFASIAWAAPIAGAIVGGFGAAALYLGWILGLPASVVATLGLAVAIAVSGGLHEDGLADVADGFGGGSTREAKLAILKDSRLGVFGGLALALALVLRVSALAGALNQGVAFACGAFILASAVARASALAPLALLPPARADGAGASASRGLEPRHYAAALAGALGLAVIIGISTLGMIRALIALVAAIAAAHLIVALAQRQIGGQTGDVAGAAAVAAETAALVVALIWLRTP